MEILEMKQDLIELGSWKDEKTANVPVCKQAGHRVLPSAAWPLPRQLLGTTRREKRLMATSVRKIGIWLSTSSQPHLT
jgi:hypothetical protein